MQYIPFPKSAVHGLSWPALPGSAGTMMLAILGQINESQWWPEELIRFKQFEQLRELIEYARINVPYYREVLPSWAENDDFEDYFRRLPLLTRDTLVERFHALQTVSLPESHGNTKQSMTSGSTGKPVVVNHSSMFAVFEGCGLLRQHRWHNRNFMGTLVGIHHQFDARERFSEGPDQPTWGWPVDVVYPSGPTFLIELYRPVQEQVSRLLENNPDYILSAPSNVLNLAEYCLANGITFPNLKNVSTMMEVVSGELRRACNEAWGVPVIDNYSCREAGTLANQCPDNDHYHVCAENVLVEILDADDMPCAPGESGRVVVTSLRNFAMPLIRYELSDHAEVGEPCECGRGLPVIKQIKGRVRNMLKLPNGERRWARMGRPGIRKLAPVQQYQFVQTALDTIEVRLVTARPLTRDEENSLTVHFHGKLPYPYRIVYRYLEEIPRGPGGKIEDFTCEV